MMFGGYDNQNNISNRLPMPVDVLADTAYLQDISGETLQLYYWNSNVITIDAGQAAGTMVIARFAYSGILDALGAMIGNSKDTSVTFTTGTVLTTEVACDYSAIEAADKATLEQIATTLTANMSNGEYCIDYRNGVLYGLKATTGVSDTVAYKVLTQTTGGGSSIAANVKITDGTDTADVLARTTGSEQPANTDDALVVYDVSGGAASVNSIYRATTNGNGDGTVVYASASTLTVSGAPFTIQNEDLVYIREVDATGNTSSIWVNGASGVELEISSGTITKTGGSDFSANGVYELGFNGQDKGYTAATTSNRMEEIDPLDQKYVGETLLNLTNIAANTTAYGYVDMAGARYITIQNETSGTTPTDTLTLTLEATCQDDGTAAASCTYQDVTSELTGSASFIDTDCMWIIDTPLPVKYLRVKYVTSNTGGSDADLTTYVKRMY